MIITEVEAKLPDDVLPDADWADCYQLITDRQFDNALEIADEMIGKQPFWIAFLLKFRDIVVAPFGLKSTGDISSKAGRTVGFFPILSESEEKVVLGADDSHLNFRLVIDLIKGTGENTVSVTTLIKRNNWVGRFYLGLIMPFHILIVKYSLRSVGR